MRVSNTQRSLYLQCPKKYYFRYVRKMRSRDKGSALFFGTAFDQASDVLFHEKDLSKAKEKFSDLWLTHEDNTSCKFSKSDLDTRIYSNDDLSRLSVVATELNKSKAKTEFQEHGDVVKLIKDVKKVKENPHVRDLTDKEEKFLHYANILCMNRKGHLMLESFYENILPHVTEVISTQTKVDIKNVEGDTIIGYIDLLCKMEGYKLPNGRVLTKDDLVVADVKTAGNYYWNKLDDLTKSDQLDTYLASPQVQELGATNVICYMAVSKVVSKEETAHCSKCDHVKSSSHKTCNNEVDGSRCHGEWISDARYYCEPKIVIGERNLQEASHIYNDYDDIVHGIKAGVFPRNRDACDAYGAVCDYIDLCGKCLTPQQLDDSIEKWKLDKGE